MKLIKSNDIKSYILNNFDQVKILSHYLEIEQLSINYCLERNSNRISNPLRVDNNPSMGFRYYDTKDGMKLFIRDFANSYYSGDIFDIVGIAEGKNPHNPKDFIDILYSILKSQDKDYYYAVITKNKIQIKEKKEIDVIEIEPRDFNINDYKYWISYGIMPEHLTKYNIIPINRYWKNQYINKYFYSDNDPCYCYYLGKKDDIDIVKLYFIKRLKGAMRFDTNCSSFIEAPHELTNKTNLIITKSRKDKILMTRIVNDLDLDVCITNASSERIIPKNVADILKNKYINVFSIFDFDDAGVIAMKEMYNRYGILHPSSLPVVNENFSNIKAKDISDFCYFNLYNKTKDLFLDIFTDLINLTNGKY